MIASTVRIVVGLLFLTIPSVVLQSGAAAQPRVHRHVVVYGEKEKFAGWPANHGAWNWGREILVGCVDAHFLNKKHHHSMHKAKPWRAVLARSLDGGETWSGESILCDDARNWDIGYTRSVVRPDQKVVTLYYFTGNNPFENHIAATIWDPDDGR